MKKTLLIACLIAFSAGTAMAQQQGGPGSGPGFEGAPGHFFAGGPANPAERLTERLGLDANQAAEVAGIFEEAQMLRDEERARARLAADEMRASIHERIRLVLTPEQLAQYEEQLEAREQLRLHLEDMRAEHGFGGGHGMGGGAGDCIND